VTDEEEIALAKRVPAGSRRAMFAMTETPQFPGFKTFNANAAHNLSWMARSHGGLAKSVTLNRRAAFYLTQLGLRIRDRLPRDSGSRAKP
jgi:hypothetical protein